MTLPHRILTLSLCVAALALPASLQAYPGGKGKEGRRGAGKALKECDADHNGQIDAAEIEAVRKAFDADKTGPLQHLDKNGDGKLDDAEITGAKVPQGGKGRKKGNA